MKTLKNIYSLIERLENRDGFLLNEITVKDKWQKESNKWQGKFDAETFEKLCSLDPTTSPNKVGRYANWILAKYNPNADLERLKVCLEWYADGIKRGIINRLGISNDINAYKSYDEFISAMNGVMHSDDSSMSNSEYNNRQKLEGQFEIVGSNSMFDIVACKTFAAERYFGSGTEWCTVANESYFNSYMKKGPLFIIYPKNGNEELKMQFHFESQSFADKYDEVYEDPLECIEETIEDENIQSELIQLCKKVFPKHQTKFMTFEECLPLVLQRLANGENPSDVFDMVDDFQEGFAIVKLNGEYNFINHNGEIISDQWFDGAYDFKEGFAKVMLDGKCNFINQEGEIAFDQWYYWVDDFHEGCAVVKLNGKWNFINQEGLLITDQWYDRVEDFHEGCALVELNEKYNFINQNGQPINDQWYDMVWNFQEGFAAVKLDGKWNFINQKGQPINDQWYDMVGSFREGFAAVKLDFKWNFINREGLLISNRWVHWCQGFYNGFSRVILNGQYYNMDTSGRLHNINENKEYKTNKNMGQRIRLTESDLHRMIKESVKQVINESAFNNVGDAYNYYISELEDMTSSRDLLGRFIVKVRKKIGEQEVVNILKTIYQEVEQAEKEELAMWDDDYDDFEDETDVY